MPISSPAAAAMATHRRSGRLGRAMDRWWGRGGPCRMALEAAHDDVELTFETGGRDAGRRRWRSRLVAARRHPRGHRRGVGARVALLHVSEVAGRHRVLARDQQGVQLRAATRRSGGDVPSYRTSASGASAWHLSHPGPARCRTPGRRRAGVADRRSARNRCTRIVVSLKPRHFTHFSRRGALDLAQQHHGPLPLGQPLDGAHQPFAAFAAQRQGFRRRVSRHGHPLQRAGVAEVVGGDHPRARGASAPSPGPGSC